MNSGIDSFKQPIPLARDSVTPNSARLGAFHCLVLLLSAERLFDVASHMTKFLT